MTDTDKFLNFVVEQRKASSDKTTHADKVRAALLDTLAALGGLNVTDDDIRFEGSKIVLPETYQGRVPDAILYLKNYVKAQENHYEYSRTFKYRPWDGANAFQNAMMKLFGTTGIGKATVTMFGSNPPQMVSIDTGVNESIQVPWGEVSFDPLEATFTLSAAKDREYGLLFQLSVDAPKKYRKHIDAFFQFVDQELRENSIYKGKAINGAEMPGFLNTHLVDPKSVVYSDEVLTQLNANLWTLIDHTEEMRRLRIPLKRAILLEGPYGTGKSLAGALTAQRAVANGWTYILCRPGQDDLFDVLKTAQLYAPAVVWFEDIDTVASGGSQNEISKLLDALDGITNKGGEVIAGFTTNFVDQIQKGVLRPGRLDAVIHIGELDRSGFEKLTKNLVPDHLLDKNVDYDLVAKAFTGFLPAFATEAISRAMRYSVARNNGKPDSITTDDLVNAAIGLRPQYALMNGAKEGANKATLDGVITEKVENVLNRTRMGGYKFKVCESTNDNE